MTKVMLELYRAGMLDWLWLGAGAACAGASVWIAAGRPFHAAQRFGRGAWGAALPLFCVVLKLCQYGARESILDSAVMVNLAWNAAHGNGLTSSLLGGVSYWSIHFAFAYALLSPALWIWPSAAPFFVLHGLALGSVPLCAYLLARGRGREALGWAAAALAAGNPLVCGVLSAVLDNGAFALPLFLWSAYCWETGRRRTAAALLLLMISTRETIPFLFAGLGAYAWVRAETRGARARAAAAIAGAAALWLGEMAVVSSARAAAAVAFDYWGLFPALGGTRAAVVETLRLRPWAFAEALVWPPAKIGHAALTLLSLGLLPLASGAALLPALAAWVPHQLGDPATNFHRLIGHQGAYVAGPLIWSAVVGLRRLDARLSSKNRERLVAWTFAVAAAGFFSTGEFRLPPGALPSVWLEEGPRAAAAVPDGAAVWSDVFFATELAARRSIKALPLAGDPNFEAGNFPPDAILLSRHWLARAAPSMTGRVRDAIRERGLVPVFTGADVLVFARPR